MRSWCLEGAHHHCHLRLTAPPRTLPRSTAATQRRRREGEGRSFLHARSQLSRHIQESYYIGVSRAVRGKREITLYHRHHHHLLLLLEQKGLPFFGSFPLISPADESQSRRKPIVSPEKTTLLSFFFPPPVHEEFLWVLLYVVVVALSPVRSSI